MKDAKFTRLSPLESRILRVLWSKKKSKVRDIYNSVRRKKSIALTSVAVILDRLHKKGLVRREISSGRGGFHYTYYPVHDEEGFKVSIIEKTTEQLISAFGSTAVNYFNEKFSKRRPKK